MSDYSFCKFDFAFLPAHGPVHKRYFKVLSYNYCNFLVSRIFSLYCFPKYIVTLFYKKLRINIVVCLLRESGPRFVLFCLVYHCLTVYQPSTAWLFVFTVHRCLTMYHVFNLPVTVKLLEKNGHEFVDFRSIFNPKRFDPCTFLSHLWLLKEWMNSIFVLP